MATKYIDDFEEYKKKIIKENLEEVPDLLDKGELDYKIERYIEKYPNISKDEIYDAIKNRNPFVSSIFAKDEKKQNISENYTKKCLEENMPDYKITKLPSSGPDCVHVENGILLKGESNKNYQTKSIDFKAEKEGKTIYISDKRIDNKGGAQDNQFKDVVNFMKNSRDNNDKNVYFVAICNGDYFYQPDPKNEGKTKLDTLNDFGKKGKTEAHDLDSFFENFDLD